MNQEACIQLAIFYGGLPAAENKLGMTASDSQCFAIASRLAEPGMFALDYIVKNDDDCPHEISRRERAALAGHRFLDATA